MTKPRIGDVWRYHYLWSRQREAGEREGRKSRPVSVVAITVGRTGETNLFLLPITSQPPAPDRDAIEIPEIERRRAGLDDKPLWVMLDEYNHDILERSYHFEPNARVGSFGASYHRMILRQFVLAAKAQRAKRVPRR
ncbi:MAG: hypothetical protein KGM42_00480 [Hyphomicrobiales bacterium]|nr:hypothetical protein [Hyphomicrobiales bacterium]